MHGASGSGPLGLAPRRRHTVPMDTDEPDAFSRNLAYRIAYGHAWRALERDRIGPNAPGRDPRMQLDALTRWVVAEMGDAGREMGESVAEGVKDAVERRRPRG